MQRRITAVAALTSALLVVGYAPAASAAIIHLTQERLLVAHTTAGPSPLSPTHDDNQRETSPALGSFNRDLSASSTYQAPPPSQNGSWGTASVSQVVNYNPTAINARLDLAIRAWHAGGASSAEGQTNWRTTFRVDQPTDVHLVGEVVLRDFGNLGTTGSNSWSVFLTGAPDAGGEIHHVYGDGGGGPFAGADRDLDVRDTLRPGYVYTFGALLTAAKATEGGVGLDKRVTGHADVNLFLVPEPSAAAALLLGATLMLRRRRV